MKRRGFFGKLAGLLGLTALSSRPNACSCDPFANLDMMGRALSEGPPINLAELLPYRPGTLKMGTPRQERDGSWTIPYEYRPQGWDDAQQECN